VDSQGNLFIANYSDNRVRKVTPAGIITTVAGDGAQGSGGDGGPATSAQVAGPWGLSIDSLGNLFIAEYLGNRIRKVNSSGIITTVAGTGTYGFGGDGGPAIAAQLRRPYAVTADSQGNLYITDTDNERIRKVDASGIITTIAGTGVSGYNGDNIPATSAYLNSPTAVVLNSAGNLFFSDESNNRVRKIDSTGVITTIAGTGVWGYNGDHILATSAMLAAPEGIAFDSQGNLYIVEIESNRVRKVGPSGTITTFIGTGVDNYNGDNLPAPLAELEAPSYVAVDNSGSVVVTDYGNGLVRKVFGVSTGSMTLTLTTP
jgi:sugar lactone lactonase YvrE